MRQFLVIATLKGHALRPALRQRGKKIFVTRIAAAQHHQTRVAFLQQLRQCIEQQFKAFLQRQATDHTDQRSLRQRFQPDALLQQLFELGLDAQLISVVMPRQVAVVSRVPVLVIDAIEQAGQMPCALTQYAIEAPAVFGRLDLLRVSGAHGADVVGVQDALAQRIDAAGVAFTGIQLTGCRAQTRVGRKVRTEAALIAQVV